MTHQSKCSSCFLFVMFSASQKILSKVANIFSVTKTMVTATQKMLSVASVMFFATEKIASAQTQWSIQHRLRPLRFGSPLSKQSFAYKCCAFKNVERFTPSSIIPRLEAFLKFTFMTGNCKREFEG